jgi:hypothetical protein
MFLKIVKMLRKCIFLAFKSKFSWGELPDPPLDIGSNLRHSIIPFFLFLEETLPPPPEMICHQISRNMNG